MKKICIGLIALAVPTLGVCVYGIVDNSAQTPVVDITYINEAPAKTQPYINNTQKGVINV